MRSSKNIFSVFLIFLASALILCGCSHRSQSVSSSSAASSAAPSESIAAAAEISSSEPTSVSSVCELCGDEKVLPCPAADIPPAKSVMASDIAPAVPVMEQAEAIASAVREQGSLATVIPC